jgi:hypothetical protein
MKNILIIGDSHATAFDNTSINAYKFKVVSSVGASAQGLLNVSSKTKGLKNTIDFLESNTEQFNAVILYFGEVDCNATIWHYKEKYNQTLEEAIDRTIKNYKTFIQKYIEPVFSKSSIIIFAPILPTVQDGYTNKGKLRKHIQVPLVERTTLTLAFENHLKDLDYKVLSINDILLDKDTNTIKLKYVHNPADHHLKNSIALSLWIEKLNSIFYN